MVRGRPVRVSSVVRSFFFVVALGAATTGCGEAAPPPGHAEGARTITAPLAAAVGTSDSARATYYAGEAARYRDIANQERQMSAAYAKFTPAASDAVTKDWNATLKASADARATAADQIATRIQVIADFHAAAAAKAVGQ
jgi:hypothetical protein